MMKLFPILANVTSQAQRVAAASRNSIQFHHAVSEALREYGFEKNWTW